MGNLCEWSVIRKIADKYNLILIEDSADTLGSTLNNGIPSGKFTDLSITSFWFTYYQLCREWRSLALNNEDVCKKAKLLRSWGRSSSLFDERSEEIENRFNINLDGIDYDAKFVFEEVGYNLEGNELGAAFGLAQLKKLENNIKIRQYNFQLQTNFFRKYNHFFSSPIENKGVSTAWLAFPILINKSAPFSRKEFQIYLEERNIQTRVVFTGNILRQPMCKGILKRITSYGLEKTDAVMERGVLLPLHHGMTSKMFERLHETIENFLKKY